MSKSVRELGSCARCGKSFVLGDLHHAWFLGPNGDEAVPFYCRTCLNDLRTRYVEESLERDQGELSEIEREVVRSLENQELISENLNIEFEGQRTLGEKLADKVAGFGGSWPFIASFLSFIVLWIAINQRASDTFDPFPFILLNLILSCIAAIQAPIIMMSQNRQEQKDRLRAINDYRTNLKAELEIRHLHDKLDHLLTRQMRRLMEVQELQMEMIKEIRTR